MTVCPRCKQTTFRDAGSPKDQGCTACGYTPAGTTGSVRPFLQSLKTNNGVFEGFRGSRFFLSNFYPAKVIYQGKSYPTSEHAFQAAKTKDPEWRETIRTAETPGRAKRLGREAPLRPDWPQLKIKTMAEIIKQKFHQHADLRKKLLDTGSDELVEYNYWGDTFWGVCNGRGSNWLGRLLMKLREEIKNEYNKKRA